MSYLSSAIAAVLKEEGMNQAELARLSGIDEGKISRIVNDQSKAKPDDTAAIAAAISKDRRRQATVIAARLKDHLTGPGSELIEIVVHGRGNEPLELRETESEPPLDAKIAKAWNVIRRNLSQCPELRDIIISLGSLFEKGEP